MRLLLLFLIPLAFAQAPFEEAVSYNNQANATFQANTTEFTIMVLQREIPILSNFTIAGPSLLLDNITYPVEGLTIIIAANISQGHLWAKPADGLGDFICDADWYNSPSRNHDYNWRCDLDNDYCVEFENQTYISYNMTVNFTLGNFSEAIQSNSTHIPVPESILLAMENASGFEYLDVNIEGNVTYVYEIVDRISPDCYTTTVNYNASQTLSLNKSILAGGYQKLFFLQTPILREQWFRNNQFNVVVLSQVPLEYAEITLNGNSSVNYTPRYYSITTNEFGLQEIISALPNEANWAEDINASSPFQLERHNHSFTYIYQFNYSYAGLGQNNLSLYVVDSFENEAYYNETLLSRMLSHNNSYTETGISVNASTTRKSGTFEMDSLMNVEIVLGFLSALVILLFLNFWIKR
ncbi:hypothetical protein JXA56_00895 [Candidatus Micrarchaeota archaeon]|nr:hypothetical protein [Candidatus Micrarchaeota archaeon]